MGKPKYSVIVPVYNRPQEVDELLQSLVQQSYKNIEVIIVEDGSSNRCDHIVDNYRNILSVQYFYKQNSGPGPSRNMGYAHASGDYFVVFDSDCILPPTYFEEVEKKLTQERIDAWGGPDRAHTSFTTVQRAMGYTMSSILTTGGIRGGKKHVGWFQPRSYNMGISKEVFLSTGGFQFDRFAEDIEFSIRMKKEGFIVVLIPEAYVYHKRRTSFKQFYYQVHNFGKGRALVGKAHAGEIKLAHWFPTFFVAGCILMLPLFLISGGLFMLAALLFVVYMMAIFFHSWKMNNNLKVAFLSIPSAFLQLWGYGVGFLKERLKPTPQKNR